MVDIPARTSLTVTTTPLNAPTPSLSATPKLAATSLAILAGVALAVFWSYEFVDNVLGQGIHDALIRGPLDTSVLSGALVGGLVTGLAGTFTACNVACFATIAPLTQGVEPGPVTTSRRQLLRTAAGRLGILALGLGLVAFLYGILGVLAADYLPQLSDGKTGSYPNRLVQASLINGILGLAFVVLGFRALSGRAIAGTRRGMLGMGALLGLLLVGRPYPMFRELFADAAHSGNPLQGGGALLLVAIGNIAIMALLAIAMLVTAGPALARLSGKHPSSTTAITGVLLLALGVFSVVYWLWRVPAMFGGFWFPGVG